MLFIETSYLFLFLPIVIALFYAVTPRFGAHAGFLVLLVASLIFYLPWGAHDMLLLLGSVALNFAAIRALLILGDSRVWLRGVIHAAGQIYNFASLFCFKYGPVLLWFTSDKEQRFSLVNNIVPIGISFYTFQQAMFLLETYQRMPTALSYLGAVRGWIATARALLRYAFFVLFFPHLVIGPIVYVEEFQPQVDAPGWGRAKRTDIEVGLAFLAIGLFKKAVLADNLAPMVDSVFAEAGHNGNISTVAAWAGALGYCFQLYFDFSGYADMALGSARLFGVRYPANFYSPFKAVSISEYYRRWHITLTRVISRFVFLPLSIAGTRFAAERGWRGLPARMVGSWLPLLANFELIGLWHGARVTFAMFGLIHGVWCVLDAEFRRLRVFQAWTKRTSRGLPSLVAHMAFLLPLVITFVLFRSFKVVSFVHYVKRMFSIHGGGAVAIHRQDVLILVLCGGVVWLLPNGIEFLSRYRPAILTYRSPRRVWPSMRFSWRPDWAWTAFAAILVLASLFCLGQTPPFLYMGF